MALIVASIQYLLPIAVLVFLIRNKDRLSSPEIKVRFGSLYEGLKLTSIHLSSICIFMVRRMLLILTAVMMTQYPAF